MPEIQTDLQFYTPWPKFGKRLNFQWGELRQDVAILKAIARAQVQDVETGDDFVNANRVLAGLEFGEQTSNTATFKNQFRLFYDKDNDKFCIQRNTGTEDSPVWVDYLCIDQASGLVTVTGLDAGALGIGSSGGFYDLPDQRMQRIGEIGNATPTVFAPPRTNALWFNSEDFYLTHKKSDPYQGTPVVNLKNSFGLARTFNASGVEWIINHNFNISPVMAQVVDNQDRVIIPDVIDVSDPNTAYFYFDSTVSGKVMIATGGLGVAEIAPLDPFYLIVRRTGESDVPRFDDYADLLFDRDDFYIGYVENQHKAVIRLGDSFASLSARVDALGSPDKFYGLVVKHSDDSQSFASVRVVAFNKDDFYVTQNSPNIDEVVVSLRANPQQIDHGNLSGLSDDDHSQYLRTDGTRALTGNQSAGGNRITNLGEPSSDSDAARLQDIGPGFYGIVVKQSDGLQSFEGIRVINFNTDSFYVEQTSPNTDEVMVNFRGNVSSSGSGVSDHGALSGLSDDDHPQYLLRTETPPGFYGIFVRESDGNPPTFRNDTIIFDSDAFYLHANSVGKPVVSLRGSGLDSTSASNLGAGSGVFAQEVANDLQFKSLVAGSNITITPSSTEITIASTASGSGGTFYSKLSNLEDTEITSPAMYDLLQFYSTQEGRSQKWVNRPYLQLRAFGTESQTNEASDIAQDFQAGNVTLFALNEALSTGPVRLWVKSGNAFGTISFEDAPAWDLARDSTLDVSQNSGSSFTRGQIVAAANNAPAGAATPIRVQLANSAAASTMPAIGVAMSTITSGTVVGGTVLVRGILGGMNTSGMTAGQVLYVSETTAGAFTNTTPTGAGSHRQPIGVVCRVNATTGRIFFNFGPWDDAVTISDGDNSHVLPQSLGINHNQFYLTRNASRSVINWDLNEGFQDKEIKLSGNSKNINWDWSQGNAFHVKLEKNTTLHTPTNRPNEGRAQTVNLVVQQPSSGFYTITFSKKYKFPGGDQLTPTLRAGAVDLYSFHISTVLGRDFIIATQAPDLFY